jgi:hypothetical protein
VEEKEGESIKGSAVGITGVGEKKKKRYKYIKDVLYGGRVMMEDGAGGRKGRKKGAAQTRTHRSGP